MRTVGGGLILLAALLIRRRLLSGPRRTQRLRRELCAAFEGMAQELSLTLEPLPRLLRREQGDLFRGVSERLDAECPLAEAWTQAAQELPLSKEERELLAAAARRLGGEAEETQRTLALCAAQLRRAYEHAEAGRHQRERLTTTFCLCTGILLVILLI